MTTTNGAYSVCSRARAAHTELASYLAEEKEETSNTFSLKKTLPDAQFHLVHSYLDHPLRIFHGPGMFLVATGLDSALSAIPMDEEEEGIGQTYSVIHTGRDVSATQFTLGVEMVHPNAVPDKSNIRQMHHDSLIPLTRSQARDLISLYGLAQAEISQPNLSLTGTLLEEASRTIPGLAVWAVCGGEEAGICLIGAQDVQGKGREPSRLLTFTVKMEEYTTGRVPDMTDFIRHYQSQTDIEKIKIQANASYDLLGQGVPLVQRYTLTGVSVDFSWDTPGHFLAPPGFPSVSVLKIQAVPGPDQPITGEIYAEVSMLGEYVKVLCNEGGNDWPCGKGPFSPLSDKDLVKAVSDWATESAVGYGRGGRVDHAMVCENSKTITCSPLLPSLPPRSSLDFTDRLWQLACRTNGVEQLGVLLKVVFENLVNGKLMATVNKANRSPLATMVNRLNRLHQDDIRGRQTISNDFQLCLTTENSVRTLVEIGLDKLQRDFMHYFLVEDMATGASLEPYMNPTDSLAVQYDGLKRLLCVLELLATKYAVAMPTESLCSILCTALLYYREHDSTSVPVFSVPLPSSASSIAEIRSMCTVLNLRHWILSLSSGPPEMTTPVHQAIFSTSPLFSMPTQNTSFNNDTLTDDPNPANQKIYLYTAQRRSVIRGR